MVIRALNNLTENAPKTFLSFPEVAGTNILRWRNPGGLTANWAIQIGETGEETSEIVNLSASVPAGPSGTIAGTTRFSHQADTPIYGIKYDQIVFEKSTAGTAGTATPIANGTINIQPDSQYTIFDDVTGTTTDAWKTYYRSSALSVNTTESDWITSGGYSFYSLAKIRERIKEKLWTSKFITDSMINNWINEWQEKMRNAAIAVNEDYALGTAAVTFGTSGMGTISNADFKSLRRVDITYNGSDWYLATKTTYNSFLPTQVFNSTHPMIYMQGENILGVKPELNGGTAKIGYYQLGTVLTNDTDELPTSMRGYTQSFVSYALSQARYKENKKEEGDGLYGIAMADLNSFRTELSPRIKTGATYVKLIEPISAEETWL